MIKNSSRLKAKETQPAKVTKASKVPSRSRKVDVVEFSDVSAGDPSSGIGARLRFLRDMHGLSQRELARRAGLTHATVGAIEREVISPSVGS
jgi:DNA-binding transcriptional regulator YiaG